MKKGIFQEIYSFGDRYVAISEEQSITYNELSGICDKISKIIIKRSLILHLCSNSLGAFAGYVAFVNNNHVQMLLSEDTGKERLNRLISLYHPQYLFLPKKMEEELECNDFPDYKKVLNIYGYLLLRVEESLYYCMHEDLALLLTTSGSTGSPKYVRVSYKNIYENTKAIANYLELDLSQRPVTVLPMWYTYGLSIINSHLLVGATLLITNRKIVELEFWKFFNKYVATSISGTPYTYQILYKIGFMQMNIPSLKMMTQAGGKLSEKLQKKFGEFSVNTGIRFYVMYGQTEATARIAYLPFDMVVEKCGSIGMAIPGGRLALLDDNGNEIKEADVNGEIIYYGPNVSMGYANCAADLERGDERSGVLHTGDIGKRDKDGFYYITGRKSRFIKMFGNRVSLDEIETLIKNRFCIIECGCCGSDDNLWIYITIEDQEFRRKIKEYVAEKTKINITGITVKFIGKLPIDESGKVQYKILEKE